MEATKKTIAERVYERFKLKWMMDHGFTITDICKLGDEYCKEVEPEDRSEITFEDYLEDVGLGSGSLWPCFDEFMDCEFTAPDVINPLLVTGTGELEEYTKNLVNYLSED